MKIPNSLRNLGALVLISSTFACGGLKSKSNGDSQFIQSTIGTWYADCQKVVPASGESNYLKRSLGLGSGFYDLHEDLHSNASCTEIIDQRIIKGKTSFDASTSTITLVEETCKENMRADEINCAFFKPGSVRKLEFDGSLLTTEGMTFRRR